MISHDSFQSQTNFQRFPASADLTCLQLQKRILSQNKKRALEFDQDLYQRELTYFQARDRRVEWSSLERPEKVESLLAFIHSQRLDGADSFSFHSLSLRQQKRLEVLTKKISLGRAFIWRDIEDFTAELISLSSAPQGFLQGLQESSKRRVLNRLLQEEFTTRGLLAFYPKFQTYRSQQQAYEHFKNSRMGQMIFTGFLNLPVLSGFPPLFLPSFKKPRLSADLLESVIELGLNESRYIAIEEELGTQLQHLSFKERYEIFKRYYMIASGVATTLIIIQQTYEADQELQTEGLLLAEFEQDLGDLLEEMESLQTDGYQVFNDDEFKHPACLSIERCQSQGEVFDVCQSLFDRRKLCQEN